jgi:uncharacterized protein YfaT (DUF1175 family)
VGAGHIVTSSAVLKAAGLAAALAGVVAPLNAQVRLADASDRAAFRSWFVLLADAQFERPAHTPAWARDVALPFTPTFPDVRSGPKPEASGWKLFRVAADGPARYAEFADARTLVHLNARSVSRDVGSLQPGDLLYFRQPAQRQPDHLMVFVGRSFFDPEHSDWVVYHTGPSDDGPGEVRKVRLRDLSQHPAPRWRPLQSNPQFVGVFRLSLL